jgi:FkbM family methyltransferase
MEYNLEHYVTSLLDVGANHGNFSKEFRDRYRPAEIVCLEPAPAHIDHLRSLGFEVHPVGASNVNEKRKFHVNKHSTGSTGNSFYLEQTVHFGEVEEIEVDVVTLDSHFLGRTFDFIKIDTQGSEYDIVVGGQDLIKRCKYLLIEVPFFPFNRGAKLAHEVIPLISSLGLKPVSFPEYHFAVKEHFVDWFTPNFNGTFITHMDILWKNF